MKKNRVSYIELKQKNYGLLTQKMKDGLAKAAVSAFGPSMPEDEVMDHILPTDAILIGYNDGGVIGFASIFDEDDAVKLEGTAVHKEAQGFWRLFKIC